MNFSIEEGGGNEPRPAESAAESFPFFMTSGETHTAEATLEFPESMTSQPEEELGAFEGQAPTPELKKRNKLRVPLLSTLAAAALLLAVAGGVAAVRGPVKRALQGLDEEAKALHLNLDARAEELQRRWEAASPRVQRAFKMHFMPKFPDMEVKEDEVVQMFMKHVNGMRELAVPSLKQEEERHVYVRQMKLVTTVLAAASDRLRLLESLERFHLETMAEVPVLMEEDMKPLPPFEELEKETKDLIPFENFVKMIPGGIFPFNSREADGKFVPKVILDKLVNMSYVEETIQTEDAKLVEAFNKEFVSLFGTNLKDLNKPELKKMQPIKLEYDNSVFDCSMFVEHLHQRRYEASHKFVDDKLMENCAANWSVKGMRRLLTDLWGYHRHNALQKVSDSQIQIKRTFRPPGVDPDLPVPLPPRDHLMMLAVFLV